MKYKVVVWDLDGTLLDTLDDLMDSVNLALAEFSLPLRNREEIRSFVGNGIMQLVTLAVPKDTEKTVFDGVFDSFKGHYATLCQNKTKPYEGVAEVVKRLRSEGVLQAVVSNKVDTAVKQLVKFYFGDVFDVAIGETEKIKRKPAPDTVFEALRILNARGDAVYVGDSEVDIMTAKNSNLPCISVDWGFRTKEQLMASGATAVVSSPDALFKLL